MASTVETVPTEILTQIFQLIYDHCRQLYAKEDDDERPRFQVPDPPSFFSEQFIPSMSAVRHQFAGLRCVSRSWKDIADTFLFRDIVIAITGSPSRLGYFNREHRFLDNLYSCGYANLICHVHIQVDVVGGPRGPRPSIFRAGPHPLLGESIGLRDRIVLRKYVHLIRDVLSQCYGSRRRLFLCIWGVPHYSDDISPMNAISSQVIDILQELPESYDVEFSGNDINLWLRDYEGMLATRLSRFLSKNLCSLDITCRQPISKQFFASLHRTKRLHLTDPWHHMPLDPNTNRLQPEDVTEAIELIPTLEELTLQKLPFLRIPSTLRRLFLMGPAEFFPEPEFFVTICQNTLLEDLRFVFSPVHLNRITSIFSSTQLSILDQAQLPNLKVLQACIVQIGSKLLTRFCSTLLRACTSLHELKLYGFILTNEMILGTSTTSLRKVNLSGHTSPFNFSTAEAGAHPESVDVIQWATLNMILKRNPNISELRLSFNPRLPPVTYNDIDMLSSNCPRLNYLELNTTITDYETVSMLLDNVIFPCQLKWLYTRGSAVEDKVIMNVLTFDYDDEWDESNFTVNLHHFRELNKYISQG